MAITFDTEALGRLKAAMGEMKGHQKRGILSRSMNRAGRVGYTRVRSNLAKEVGLRVGDVQKYGALRKKFASPADLRFEIQSTGRFLPLKLFNAKQNSKGVSHRAWGRRQTAKSAFTVDKFGGHVYARTSKNRFPIKKLFGPSIPNEMVKGESQEVFVREVAPRVVKNLNHEFDRYTKRVKSKYGL